MGLLGNLVARKDGQQLYRSFSDVWRAVKPERQKCVKWLPFGQFLEDFVLLSYLL